MPTRNESAEPEGEALFALASPSLAFGTFGCWFKTLIGRLRKFVEETTVSGTLSLQRTILGSQKQGCSLHMYEFRLLQ